MPGAQVNVAEEEDAFAGVVTACLSVLVLGVETRLDAVLTQMTRLPWASLESVRAPCGNSAVVPGHALSGGCGCPLYRTAPPQMRLAGSRGWFSKASSASQPKGHLPREVRHMRGPTSVCSTCAPLHVGAGA